MCCRAFHVCARCGKQTSKGSAVLGPREVLRADDYERLQASPFIKCINPVSPAPIPPKDEQDGHMSVFEFASHLIHGSITSGDGGGYFADEAVFDREAPVDCERFHASMPHWATHVVWFNK